MSTFKLLFITVSIGLLFPLISHGQISISEIMYDPSGADTKREWIEVLNEGESGIDLTTWFFLENNVFHKITAYTESILKAGQYAVIADSAADFLLDYPGFAGLVFDSAFSLNNTGEPLTLANTAKETIDAFTYSSDMGGASDGNSLQINSGLAISASPTPSAINKTQSETPDDTSGTSTSTSTSSSTSNTSTNNSSTHSGQTPLSTYTPTTPFKLGIGRNRTVPIQTPVVFEAEVSDSKASLIYEWNFGDLNTARDKRVSHTYDFEGTYHVVLTATDKETKREVVSRAIIEVIKPDIVITQDALTIQISNTSSKETNIGEFVLQYATRTIRIPKNTIIGAGNTLTLGKAPYDAFLSLDYSTGETYFKETDNTHIWSAYMYCLINTQDKACTVGHIAKLFDILKGWFL